MTTRIFVKPAPGKKTRKPESLQFLSEAGESVAWSQFWQRRIDCGDVVLTNKKTSTPDVTTSAKRAVTKKGGEQ